MPSRDPLRPNIVAILSDDQGHWAMGCAGNKELRTPNLDRIAAEGMRFENFFCVSPVCSPARASLLTGRLPSQHGIHDWLCTGPVYGPQTRDAGMIQFLAGTPAYTEVLARAGWACGHSGKWHMGDAFHPQKGFTYWKAHAHGGGSYYHAPMIKNEREIETADGVYVTDLIAENAMGFLETQRTGDAPFYLAMNFTAPHSSWERAEHPADLFDSYYDHCPFESVPLAPRHPWGSKILDKLFQSSEGRREWLSGYFAAITGLDRGVGRVLEWLDRQGLRENTIVFFTGDNGMNMGHHGICGKGNGTFPLNMYDTSVKVPALISRPGHIPQGVVNECLLSHYDVMPTILEYLGLPVPEPEQLPGRSFAPLLRGERYEQREDVVVFDEYGPVRMIRTREWKYVHRYPYGPHELYHLAADPGEERNLIDAPEHQERVQEMSSRLDVWFARYVVPQRDGRTHSVDGGGQFDVVAPGTHPFKQRHRKS